VKCTKKFQKYYYIYGWPDLRSKAFKRDKYTCRKCGKRFIVRDIATGKEYGRDSELIADHIIPIALNGSQWDIDNVQTLCIKCNKIKTAKDAGDIARERKINRKLCKGQKQLQEFA
jgi:5-methylcytosine-specific restriction endonuclease McrA